MNTPQRHPGTNKFSGFTLIEIILVLAIAGLILISVFLAVGGAQRSRRDFQRKQFVSLTKAAVETYFANAHANPNPLIPASTADFENNYLPKQVDPLSGKAYTSGNSNFIYRGNGDSHSDVPPVGTVYMQYGHWCNQPGRPGVDNATDPIAGNDVAPTDFVIWTQLESGGVYCADNYGN